MRGSKETNQVHPSDLKFPRYEGIKRDQSSSETLSNKISTVFEILDRHFSEEFK
jgi:hypothetical protein